MAELMDPSAGGISGSHSSGSWSNESWTLEATAIDLELAQRFTIASHSWEVVRNVFVTLRFAGAVGVGEASPDPRHGETPESVIRGLETIDPSTIGDPFNLEGVRELMAPGTGRAALDIALHDLAGKLAQLPVSKLLGTKGRPLPPTSVTVPIAAPGAMAERARLLQDHPVLKIKVGFDGDIDVVAAIRAVFTGRLRVDANEGWLDEDEAIERLEELERFDIELCEQPVPAGQPQTMRRVREATSIDIFADEDASTAADVASLAGCVDGVNLKLRKAGGIRETMHAIATARAHRMKVMLGCDLESGVATTAGAHVAGLVDHADLDGPLLLADDPFPGVAYERGEMILPDAPGLGVRGTP